MNRNLINKIFKCVFTPILLIAFFIFGIILSFPFTHEKLNLMSEVNASEAEINTLEDNIQKVKSEISNTKNDISSLNEYLSK